VSQVEDGNPSFVLILEPADNGFNQIIIDCCWNAMDELIPLILNMF
jgi:hypothetical protein